VDESDVELLERWATGATDAAETLLSRHFDALCRFFRNKLPDGVDDLIQRTLLGVVEGRHAFAGRSTFRTYLFAIARNELFAELRKQHRAGSTFDPLESSCASWHPHATSHVAGCRQERWLLEGLRRIPLDHQIALELYFWEDMSAAEIGRVLQLPEGTVRSRIARAKALLHRELRRLDGDVLAVRTTATRVDGWARSIRERVAG
jgi:RNA polymerase sigma factor (sigma-70 family)